MPATITRELPRSLSIEMAGRLLADDEGHECPLCGGYLDVCQPDPESPGNHLVGACVECDRLTYLVVTGPVTLAFLLPDDAELAGKLRDSA